MELKVTNVNEAFKRFVLGLADRLDPNVDYMNVVERESRAGDVLMIPEPVMVTYENPLQRVLFHGGRDANPFFHVFESLWMLAGRNDVAPLKYYSSKIGEIASDDGRTFNGAYGYRWRNHPGNDQDGRETPNGQRVDQLSILINYLRNDPDGRRAVLQMWNVEDDLLRIGGTTRQYSKDVCCNTCAYFQINFGKLDMMVSNRSNDLVWGMLGANVVHFSFLQEYIAHAVGVEVGRYTQATMNLHVYKSTWKWEWVDEYYNRTHHDPPIDYNERMLRSEFVPLYDSWEEFDGEVAKFIDYDFSDPQMGVWHSPFLAHVADPMCRAFLMHKDRDYAAALHWCGQIGALDWREVCIRWIEKRRARWWEAKQ